MNLYKPRPAEFIKIHEVGNWQIKLYTITQNNSFSSHKILNNALSKVPEWLKNTENYNFENYNIACLIIHEGKEGVFSLLNWWTGENMLQNHVFLTTPDKPNAFKLLSDGGLAFCIWELGIIWHERNAWIKHILRNPESPQFDNYLKDTFSGEL